ncbi:MAG: hypothetical protein EXS08_15220 [Planctomycetes bacterium]|nr:hypothetical protein [Planctomycetota bacterium]
MRIARGARRSLLVLAIVVVGDRLLDRLLLADGLFLGRPIAPFDPPLFSPGQCEALRHIQSELASPSPKPGKFDAELGWCNKPDSGFGEFRYDWAGARIASAPLARAKSTGVRRVVAVGCSMTHGEEVGAEQSWCARTDVLLPDVEIANLGVAAYGIDQALLRLRRDGWGLEPDEVWLGILPQAAMRVTTLFRPLLDHWSLDVAFKPRFQLDAGGELELVPCSARSLEDVARLLGDQRALLDAFAGHDPWVERSALAYAPRGSSWLHGSFVARLLITGLERSGRDLASCFQEETGFGALYTAIVRSMARETMQHGARFRIILLPGKDDLAERTRTGRGYWEDWCTRRKAEGVEVVELTSVLELPVEELGTWFAPQGHYNPEASERVAGELVRRLAL